MIRIIDCGSQLTQNIARRIREGGVFSDIVPFNSKLEEILTNDVEGIIISGGQCSVYDENSPLYAREVLQRGLPVLGICYGQQSIAHLLGGKVEPAKNREYGRTKVRITPGSPLFEGFPQTELDVWMSHGDIVRELPEGFEAIAESENGHIAAMQNADKQVYAVQFHPEVDHTDYGKEILSNFVKICGANRTWKPESLIEPITDEIKEKIGEGAAIAGISGGVDSITLGVLMQRALGDRFSGVFVDNGFLRKDEPQEVLSYIRELGIQHRFIVAVNRFLNELSGIADSDEKRRVIGNAFIDVFEREAKNMQGVKYLGQGTLYPDVIESVPVYGVSSKIKLHHNVGGLPDRMDLELIEPFRDLFKDEVRKIAEELGIPKEVVWRHPFPGPGLAVRIIGDVTPEKLSLVREADAIFIDELKKRGLYYDISQAFAVLTDTQSVGVMGDEGTRQRVVGLRAVTTNDFMTSDVFHFEWSDLQAITNRIVNEVKGVNRVVYDTTQKPPGTIEWE